MKLQLTVKKGNKSVLSASYTGAKTEGGKGNFNLDIDYDHEPKTKQIGNSAVDDGYSFQFNFS